MARLKPKDKVKCIEDNFVDEKTNPFKASDINLPIKEKLYTIRQIVKTPYGTGVRLEEIKNKKY